MARLENSLKTAIEENVSVRAEGEASTHARDRFLAVLSHELRTPLTPVLMATQMLEQEPGLSAGMREALQMIRRNVETECRLLDDLLDLTRISSGRLEIDRLPLDLHAVLARAVEIARPEINARNQTLVQALHPKGKSMIVGDEARLQQAAWNLLKNASQFTPKGGEIRLSTEVESDLIVLKVADNGAGLSEEALTSIFEPFALSGPKVVRKFGGLGLGLAISRAAVAAHGGILRAESPGPGKGTIFIVELPLE